MERDASLKWHPRTQHRLAARRADSGRFCTLCYPGGGSGLRTVSRASARWLKARRWAATTLLKCKAAINDTMQLEREIKRFNEWATTVIDPSGEWETEYPHWDAIYDEVENCLKTDYLDNTTKDHILYVLARDNECEVVLKMLVAYPHFGYRVAEHGIMYPDNDARWQVAVVLGEIRADDSIALLHTMLRDSDEYVRRRSLLAIREIDAVYAEKIAIEWIYSEHEYSRLVAIDTLSILHSYYLPRALSILKEDSSHIVKQCCEKIVKTHRFI